MNILIENTVPINNGDAALIFALGEKIQSEGYSVIYCTNDVSYMSRLYPKEKWIKSPAGNKYTKIPFIGAILLFVLLISSSDHRSAHAIVSAPGGYIHEYYRFKRKLDLLSLASVFLRKKVYMYSQSIGNLSDRSLKMLHSRLKHFRLFYVRDQISLERISKVNTHTNVCLTKDAAFLLDSLKGNKKEKSVAISVREWAFEGRVESTYFKLIEKITSYFVNLGYQVIFLSTCQGHVNYKDDSKVAKDIVSTFPEEWNKNITIDSNLYTLHELRMKLAEFEFVIGTRLHMCILSWLSGVPAFNISYEEKGRESYEYLNATDFSVDYNYEDKVDDLLEKFTSANHQPIFSKIDEIRMENDYFLLKLIEDSEN